MVEGARLESEYTAKPYRGFESLPLRHFPKFVESRHGNLRAEGQPGDRPGAGFEDQFAVQLAGEALENSLAEAG